MNKTFTRWLALLAGVMFSFGSAWAEDVVLFEADFSSDAWKGHETICAGSTKTETINGITFVCDNSSKNYSISQGILTFADNNIGDRYYMAIPIDGANGSVTFIIGTKESKQRISYKFVEDATFPTSGITSSATTTAANVNTAESITVNYDIKDATKNLWLLIGRQGSGMKEVIKSIKITTPAPDCSAPETALSLTASKTEGVLVGDVITFSTAGGNGSAVKIYDGETEISSPWTATYGEHSFTAVQEEADGVCGATTDAVTINVTSTDPVMTLGPATVSVKAKNGEALATATATLAGENLTNGTYSVTTSVEGLTINPSSFTVADGAVNETFTISYAGTAEGSTTLTFSDGTTSKSLTVNYSVIAVQTELVAVPGTPMVWNWSNLTSGSDLTRLDTVTDPLRDNLFFLGDINTFTDKNWVTFSNDFTEEMGRMIQMSGQDVIGGSGDGKHCQVKEIKLQLSTNGNLAVNVGGTNTKERSCLINGETAATFKSTGHSESKEISVSSGEVSITVSDGYMRIYSITFKPQLAAVQEPRVTYTKDNSNVHIEWDAVPNAKSYEVTLYKKATNNGAAMARRKAESVDTYSQTVTTNSIDISSGESTGIGSGEDYNFTIVSKADGYADSEPYDSSNDESLIINIPANPTQLAEMAAAGVTVDGMVIRNASGMEVRVYDMQGRVVMSSVEDIDLTVLPQGMYVARVGGLSLKVVR